MTNKRDLKRIINYICDDLFAECIAASLYSGKPNAENVNSLLTTIIRLQSDYIRRVSHPEPGMPAKKYYKVLTESFNKEVSEIIDNIGNMN
ncbi:MAG: hypothetical protein IJ549_02865 [Prevotella sp.]|nr:hypothetical protein [Prevotella sp.]MBQ9651762.1 hypothetical protein [Prevotella sp.]